VRIDAGASAYILKAKSSSGFDKAVKILRKERALEMSSHEKFLQEIKNLVLVSHPNIIKIEQTGSIKLRDHTTLPYYVMEYIEGAPLEKWIAEKRKKNEYLNTYGVCAFIRQIVLALSHVHSRSPRIFHLDIKPSNILVSWEGIPKIADFGLSLAMWPLMTVKDPSIHGRPIESLHPDFRLMFNEGIDVSKLEPRFDLYGLGYTLSRVADFLKHNLDNFGKYIFNAMVMRLTAAEGNDKWFPFRNDFDFIAEKKVDEYIQADDILEALDKIQNPHYHLTSIQELQLERTSSPPVRIVGGIHVPTSDRLRNLMNTSIFQRLEWMKQLDQVTHAYPGATHTRREHSLGVYYYTSRYLRRLLQEPYFVFHFSVADIKATLLAGLLHDIAHYPMAHSIEESEELGTVISHEELGANLLLGNPQELCSKADQDELRGLIKDEWEISPDQVADIAYKPRHSSSYNDRRHNLLHSIIDGPLDADKMHYLQADSLHSGNPVGTDFDSEQLLDSLSFNKEFDGLAISDKGLAAVESFLYARYRMHIDVYWHHTVRGARKMISRAIDRYIREDMSDADRRRGTIKSLVTLSTDNDFLERLVALFKPESDAGKLIQHLVSVQEADSGRIIRPIRKLFKRIRTYDREGRGDRFSKTIFQLLYPGGGAARDVLLCEQNVAIEISDLVKTRVEPWEIIIDIPLSKECMVDDVCVRYMKIYPAIHAHKSLQHCSAVAREIGNDFTLRNSQKVRVYCSPRVRKLIYGYEDRLNEYINKAISKQKGVTKT
jgi:HD superfamily phosphohydrolase/tRNA A-37 threonylcarbamoyl transferase component Bud32